MKSVWEPPRVSSTWFQAQWRLAAHSSLLHRCCLHRFGGCTGPLAVVASRRWLNHIELALTEGSAWKHSPGQLVSWSDLVCYILSSGWLTRFASLPLFLLPGLSLKTQSTSAGGGVFSSKMPTCPRAAMALLQRWYAPPSGKLFASAMFLTAGNTYAHVYKAINPLSYFYFLQCCKWNPRSRACFSTPLPLSYTPNSENSILIWWLKSLNLKHHFSRVV